jgi:membrane associated rhomboid family serine protease
MMIPVEVDVRLRYWPYANAGMVAVCVVVYGLMMCGVGSKEFWESLVLQDYNPVQLIGSMFLHAGLLHLFFNMLFLWIFGNAVCGTIGNWRYLAVYLLGGVAAGVVHLLADGAPEIGASGAINAMIGFYFVLYPLNEIKCVWVILIQGANFKVAGYWLILFWFAWDIIWAVTGLGGEVAYWAHIGGFLAGMGMGVACLKWRWATLLDDDHPTLLDWLKGTTTRAVPEAGRRQEFQEEQVRLRQKALDALVTKAEVAPVKAGWPNCPQCGVTLDIAAELAGEQVNCPVCGKALTVVAETRSESAG